MQNMNFPLRNLSFNLTSRSFNGSSWYSLLHVVDEDSRISSFTWFIMSFRSSVTSNKSHIKLCLWSQSSIKSPYTGSHKKLSAVVVSIQEKDRMCFWQFLSFLGKLSWSVLGANLVTNFKDLITKVTKVVALSPVKGAILCHGKGKKPTAKQLQYTASRDRAIKGIRQPLWRHQQLTP